MVPGGVARALESPAGPPAPSLTLDQRDDPERRMAGRICDFALQRLQPTSQDVGLAGGELSPQTIQAVLLPCVQIHLDRFPYPRRTLEPAIMI